jgi:hypothetical protein
LHHLSGALISDGNLRTRQGNGSCSRRGGKGVDHYRFAFSNKPTTLPKAQPVHHMDARPIEEKTCKFGEPEDDQLAPKPAMGKKSKEGMTDEYEKSPIVAIIRRIGQFWLAAGWSCDGSDHPHIQSQPTRKQCCSGHWANSAAVSFTAQGTGNYLFSVSVSLGFASFPPGPFFLSLYSNAGSAPGASLAILSGNNYPTNTGVYTYTNTSPLQLSANTTYWIVASSPASPPQTYTWLDTYSTSLDSGSIWTLGVSEDFYNSSWNLNPGAYLQFSVTVASTNPPAISIFQPVVLTYTSVPAVPFVLQESPVLPGTNWVTATNAIQMTTVNSSQAVLIVPPSGQQMFFRLQGP